MQKMAVVSADNPYPLGVYRTETGIRISMIGHGDSCGIILYDKDKKQIGRYELSNGCRMGKICYGKIDVKDNEELSKTWNSGGELLYQLYVDDKVIFDTYMKAYIGRENFCAKVVPEDLYSIVVNADYDWEQDKCPGLTYEDSFIYCMHVRGFTKHSSSGVKGKGTFQGIIEKLPHLEDLGVTTLELLPVYELKDCVTKDNKLTDISQKEDKINYWGYADGFHFVPKNAYATCGRGDIEFKNLVKELHKRNMEVILQFYFPENMAHGDILEVLRYWRLNYHVDGFHLKGANVPLRMIAEEPGLSDVKILHEYFHVEQIYNEKTMPVVRNLGYYRDDYMYAMRRFLKGDEDMVSTILSLMRRQPREAGQINYISNYFGFTLADMVSYERKHNEDNGEDNRDGIDYNHTWNCGVEGKSRKKNVVLLRNKQMRNALSLLMFSQGTPLIFMGDEFGNSQNGNNNPYCQDNDITWLNWKNKEQNKELYNYVRELALLRKKHPILHKSNEMRLMDYISCGFPDLSYHATKAWQPDMTNVTRHIGVLYCGKYAKMASGDEDLFFYVAMNMHWEPHEFALPKLPKGMEWSMLMDTSEWDIYSDDDKILVNQQMGVVDSRSVQVYVGKIIRKGNGKK